MTSNEPVTPYQPLRHSAPAPPATPPGGLRAKARAWTRRL
ncbi:head decoration protein, partial [Klebsiella pneumoniae]